MVISPQGIVTIYSTDTEADVKTLPVWVIAVRLYGDVPAENVGALPAWVTTVELVGYVSEASIKALPASVTTIRFWNNAPVATCETFSGLDILAYAVAIRANEERSIIEPEPQPAPPPLKRRKIKGQYLNNFTHYTAVDFAPAKPYTVPRQPSSFSFFYDPPYEPYEQFYPKQMTRG